MTSLDRERAAAIALRNSIKTVLGDDEQALADAVEGQTNFHEAALVICREAREREALAEALAGMIGQMKTRKAWLENSAGHLRQAAATAMLDVGLKSIRGPDMTVSARIGPGSMRIDNEDLLPAWAWREKIVREPDKLRIKDRLETELVAGAVKTNGSPMLTMRAI